MFTKPIKIQHEDSVINRIQDEYIKRFGDLVGLDILDGFMLESIVLVSSGVNSVEHKLGRKIRGYIITTKDANSNIWTDSMDDKFLKVNCSANVTCSMWVF